MKRQPLPSLFDQPVLDRDAAIQARNEGIKQAEDHAEETIDGWNERAAMMLQSFLAGRRTEFMAEDVRAYAQAKGLPVPPSARAWGGVMARAKGAGVIVKIGVGQVRDIKSHRALAAIWKPANAIPQTNA